MENAGSYQTYEDMDAELEASEPIYDSEHDMLMARKYTALSQFDLAVELLVDVLKKEKTNAEANFLLGLIHLDNNDARGAIHYLREAIRWNVTNASYRAALGQAYLAASDIGLALQVLTKSLTLDHSDEVAAILAEAFMADKQCNKSTAQNWVSLVVKANTAFDDRKNEDAVELYQRVLESDPSNSAIQERLMNLERQSKYPGQVCPKPWENARLRPDGTVEVCCLARVKVGDARKKELEEIWNDDEIRKFRGSVLDDSYRYCSHHVCSFVRNGQFPQREEIDLPGAKESINANSTKVSRPTICMTMVYDQTCNLSCPSCRKEKIVLRGQDFDDAKKVHDLIKSKCLSSLTRMTICGQGDPFASRLYRDLLYSLDGAEFPDLTIHLMTNGLLFNQKSWSRMSRIHDNIDYVSISIDAATDATYAKLRRGGAMKDLRPNLEFAGNLRKSGVIKNLQFNFVVQSGNYLEMPDFAKMAARYNADIAHFQRMRGSLDSSIFEVFSPEHPDFDSFLDILESDEMNSVVVKIPWADEALVQGGRKPRFNVGPGARRLVDDDEDEIAALV